MAEAVKNATCKCKHKDRETLLHTGCLGESKHYRGSSSSPEISKKVITDQQSQDFP